MAGMGDGSVADEYNTLVDGTGYLCNRIHVSLDFLCKNSTNLPVVLVHLLSHGLLSQHESELVESKESNYNRFRQLFTFLIPRLGRMDNSRHFVNVFHQTLNEHILEELKFATVTTDFVPTSTDTSSHSVRFNVREPVSSFFGRENFLLDLHQHIVQSQRTDADVSTISTILSRICIVTGLGGIGKTETIRKYIHSYGHFYQHVVWIDAEEHNTAENQFRRLARELQLPSKDIDNKAKDFDVLLKQIYDRLSTSNTLIVLDNAEALHDSDPKRPGVACFLPKCLPPTDLKPVVLITSRQIDWPDLNQVPLPILTPQESSELLFRQLSLKESDANTKDAKTLSDTFGGLPLAIQAAVAVIRKESKRNELVGKEIYTIQHLLSDYNEGKREVLKKRPSGSPDTLPLMLLWKVSLDKIRQQPHGHLATEILNVLAHLSPTNIPKDLFTCIFHSVDEQSFVDAVALLVDYSFVQSSRGHFSIHRVLQDVTIAHLEAATDDNSNEGELLLLTPPLVRIMSAFKEYWPTVPKSSEAFDAVHDNFVHVTMCHVLPKAQNRSETDLHFIEFIEFVFEEIKNTRWVEAEKCCRVLIDYFTCSALPVHSASFFKSPNFKKFRNFQMKLAWILREMGRYKEAVDICQELLSSFNSLEDQEESISEILDEKHLLASILERQGEYKEAIKLFISVLDFYSKLHGPAHPSTLASKNNLALALHKRGRLSEAKALYVEILKVQMKNPGSLLISTLTTKHNIAMILKEEGRYDDALEILREVVEAREKELGPHHASTLRSNSCIAILLDEQGKLEDALRIYADVTSRYEKASAASHPDCLNAKHNMGVILVTQGRVDEAKVMLCNVLDTQERLLGPNHIHTLTTKHNVAWVLEIQGKDADALKLYEEVLELYTKQLGHMHPYTLQTNYNIGCVNLKMGNFEKAESILKEVLAARQATLPSDHPSIKDTEELYEKARQRNDTFTHKM